MSANSTIEWTDHTWNPWEGCTKKSPGCKNCYAEARNKRFAGANWGKGKPRRRTREANWRMPLRWNLETRKTGKRFKIFLSLCDWLDEEVPIEWLSDFLALIYATPNLIWQLLTKSPENWRTRLTETLHVLVRQENFTAAVEVRAWLQQEPPLAPQNVWLGVSVEDQERADERMPVLLNIPAKLHFLSCEPLLEPIDLENYLPCSRRPVGDARASHSEAATVDWVIAGGESGPGARPCDIQWIREIIAQCELAKVPVFVKQLGAFPFDFDGREEVWLKTLPPQYRDGTRYAIAERRIKDRKGGDPAEWPEDLRIRQFPSVKSVVVPK